MYSLGTHNIKEIRPKLMLDWNLTKPRLSISSFLLGGSNKMDTMDKSDLARLLQFKKE